jgi:hypothetical protein
MIYLVPIGRMSRAAHLDALGNLSPSSQKTLGAGERTLFKTTG